MDQQESAVVLIISVCKFEKSQMNFNQVEDLALAALVKGP